MKEKIEQAAQQCANSRWPEPDNLTQRINTGIGFKLGAEWMEKEHEAKRPYLRNPSSVCAQCRREFEADLRLQNRDGLPIPTEIDQQLMPGAMFKETVLRINGRDLGVLQAAIRPAACKLLTKVQKYKDIHESGEATDKQETQRIALEEEYEILDHFLKLKI